MLKQPVVIKSFAGISPLGSTREEIWQSYLKPVSFISAQNQLTADISDESLEKIEVIRQENNKYKNLDKTVLYALFAARQAWELAEWAKSSDVGINIGSSRGATGLFENFHSEFIDQGKSKPLTSPTTTLGNLSSWLAHDLQVTGPTISHSITCSTALHAVLNGVAWINAGLSDQFIVGGSEAANTPFTVAQMQALKIYSKLKGELPCRSLDFGKTENTMVLGEGAAVFCIEAESEAPYVAKIEGIGYATELVKHNASISANGDCFQKSMQMAVEGINKDEVDIIVMHAPGTIKGDLSELNAIKAVFGEGHPALTSNKWKLGHALGASGAFSVEMAILMLQNQKLIESPFYQNQKQPNQIKKVLVNAVGFGGNAASLLISL